MKFTTTLAYVSLCFALVQALPTNINGMHAREVEGSDFYGRALPGQASKKTAHPSLKKNPVQKSSNAGRAGSKGTGATPGGNGDPFELQNVINEQKSVGNRMLYLKYLQECEAWANGRYTMYPATTNWSDILAYGHPNQKFGTMEGHLVLNQCYKECFFRSGCPAALAATNREYPKSRNDFLEKCYKANAVRRKNQKPYWQCSSLVNMDSFSHLT